MTFEARWASVAAVPADPSSKPGAWAYLSSGTWSLMGIEVKQPIISEPALAHNFTNEGGVAGSFRFLTNIAGLWFLQECRRVWSMEDGREFKYEDMEGRAAAAKPFAFFIDPDHPSFLRPEHMPRAIADFCNQTGQAAPADRGELVRGVLESLALRYRSVRDAIEEASGSSIQVLHVVGGGSQNRLLNQFTADALGIPVVAGPVEATAIGNLAVQAIAAGVLPDLASARDLVRKSFPITTYQPQNIDNWSEAHQGSLKICP